MKLSRGDLVRSVSLVVAGLTAISVDHFVVQQISEPVVLIGSMPIRAFGVFAIGSVVYFLTEHALVKTLRDKDSKDGEGIE